MKHILLLLLLAPFLVAFNSEETKPRFEYTLTGETNSDYEGEKVYLHNTSRNELIDSTIVSDSSFSFVGKLDSIADNMSMAKITIDREDIVIVLEEGDITVNIQSEISVVSGTPHNETLNSFAVAERTLYSDLQRDMNQTQYEFEDNETMLQQRDIELVDKYNSDSKNLYDSTFSANRLNIIGAYLYPRTLSNEPTSTEINEFISENPYAEKEPAIMQLLTTTQLRELELEEDGKEYRDIVMMSFNIWQEGSYVDGGYESIVDEITLHNPDFVTLIEVRNYNDVKFNAKLVADLKKKGKTYYTNDSYDTGILSKHPISTFQDNKDGLWGIAITTEIEGIRFAVYSAHLDYTNYASYLPRGYNASFSGKLPAPITDIKEIQKVNLASTRDDAIKAFVKDAKQKIKDGTIVLLGGDFSEPSHLDWNDDTKDLYDHNGVVYNWDVSMIMQDNGFVDTYRELYKSAVTHPGFTFPSDNKDVEINKLTWAPDADERDRIDFIYYYPNSKIRLISSATYGPIGSILNNKRVDEDTEDNFITPLGVWPSDHKALISTFRLYLDEKK